MAQKTYEVKAAWASCSAIGGRGAGRCSGAPGEPGVKIRSVGARRLYRRWYCQAHLPTTWRRVWASLVWVLTRQTVTWAEVS